MFGCGGSRIAQSGAGEPCRHGDLGIDSRFNVAFAAGDGFWRFPGVDGQNHAPRDMPPTFGQAGAFRSALFHQTPWAMHDRATAMLDAGRRRARRGSRRAIIWGVAFARRLPLPRASWQPRRGDRRRRGPWSARPSAVLFACASMMRASMFHPFFRSSLFPIVQLLRSSALHFALHLRCIHVARSWYRTRRQGSSEVVSACRSLPRSRSARSSEAISRCRLMCRKSCMSRSLSSCIGLSSARRKSLGR
jgi:hypothetical protein